MMSVEMPAALSSMDSRLITEVTAFIRAVSHRFSTIFARSCQVIYLIVLAMDGFACAGDGYTFP